jgi:hypothetical protein
MKLVAWNPDLAAPPELTGVFLKPGQVSHKEWVEALSERVTELAMKENDPQKASDLACQKLELPLVESSQLGENLVTNNLDLLTNLNVTILNQNPWPSQVQEQNPYLESQLKNQSLSNWVDLALSQVSVSSLD